MDELLIQLANWLNYRYHKSGCVYTTDNIRSAVENIVESADVEDSVVKQFIEAAVAAGYLFPIDTGESCALLPTDATQNPNFPRAKICSLFGWVWGPKVQPDSVPKAKSKPFVAKGQSIADGELIMTDEERKIYELYGVWPLPEPFVTLRKYILSKS